MKFNHSKKEKGSDLWLVIIKFAIKFNKCSKEEILDKNILVNQLFAKLRENQLSTKSKVAN